MTLHLRVISRSGHTANRQGLERASTRSKEGTRLKQRVWVDRCPVLLRLSAKLVGLVSNSIKGSVLTLRLCSDDRLEGINELSAE